MLWQFKKKNDRLKTEGKVIYKNFNCIFFYKSALDFKLGN